MSVAEGKLLLSGFLKFMELDREKIVSGRLENRIKAQKFVYFGKRLGLPLSYDFDMYLYGPYSSKLADDYYSISEEDWEVGTLEIPIEIESTLRDLRTSDALFLEIAATMDSIRTNNKGVSDVELIDVISKLKYDRLNEKGKDANYLKSVLEVLPHFDVK